MNSRRQFFFLAIFAVGAPLAIFSLLEIIISIFLWYPTLSRHLPKAYRNAIRYYYLNFDRPLVQFLPDCAQFDAQLYYRLKPGQCDASAREYAMHLAVNSKGVRDSERALSKPEMIVLGDSFAMGWGVSQESTFPKLVEKAWGHRVLNAGISSYSTAREVLLLKELDTMNLKYLVFQYCNNDGDENDQFVGSNFKRPRSTLDDYKAVVNFQEMHSKYYFGQRLWVTLPLMVFPQEIDYGGSHLPYAEQARLFLEILSHEVAPSHPKLKILTLETNSASGNYSYFVDELKKQKSSTLYPESVREMAVLDLSPSLTQEKYTFDLDDHLRASGQKVIADAILNQLKSGW